MGSKAELVEQVKALQRSDPGAKQAWWDFCDTQLSGVKDPNKHDEGTLHEFLAGYETGGLPAAAPPPRQPARQPMRSQASYSPRGQPSYGPPARPSYGMAAAAPRWAPAPMFAAQQMGGMGDGLTEFVKVGQRQSENWRTAWKIYCAVYGNGINDPSKHDQTFTKGFIDYVGELAVQGLEALAAEEGVALDHLGGGGKRAAPASFGGPPAKRQSFGKGGSAGGDPQLAGLVEKVKQLQRTDPTAKQAWWDYCETNLNNIRDPSRHDADALSGFLAAYE